MLKILIHLKVYGTGMENGVMIFLNTKKEEIILEKCTNLLCLYFQKMKIAE